MPRTQIAVVGAGPAGATLACLLASRGIDVTLLERQTDFEREFRGEALTPSGVRALRDMGLGDVLERVPTARPEYVDAFNDRERIVRIPFDADAFGEDAPLIVSQPHMLEAIVEEGSKHAGFHFVRGASVTALLRRGARVSGVRAKTESGELEFEADWVVGTDGRTSRVRQLADIPVHVDATRMDVVWCKLPLPDSFRAASHVEFYLGNAHLLICYRAPDDLLQLGWVIPKGEWGDLRSRGVESWVEEMANHVTGELSSHLRQKRSEISRPFLLSTAADCCETWSQPGVLVLGDAAHTCSPVGAQGINIALRDSIVAANHIVGALRSGADLDSVGKRIQAERMPEVRLIQRLQAQPPRVIFSKNPLVQRLRGVTKLLRFGWIQRVAASRGRVFTDGVTDVKLTV